jgi:YVTN family beta-propeller protein
MWFHHTFKNNYSKMKHLLFFLAAILSFGNAFSKHAPKVGSYKIVNKIHLEGDEKWDYLYSDDQSNRLYVSHSSMVQVVDEVNGQVIGKISGLNGVHGIAIASEFGKGFITGGRDSSVTVFDTKTLAVITKITVTGKGPDAILFDPFSKKVYVFNAKSNSATVISAVNNQILATIPFAGNPEASVTDGKGRIYVNLEDNSSIAVINSSTDKVEHVWSISPGEEPTGLALDNETHRLFSVCKNKIMMIIDAGSGKIVSSQPIGERTDGAAFDPELKRAYSSNGDLTLTVIQENPGDNYSVLENVPTQKGARTVAVNKLTHHVYLPAADYEVQVGQEKPKLIPGTFVVLDIVPE